MTKEEAIENLEGCICGYEVGNDGKPNGNVTADLKQETIDMAIKALSAEPCEDYISRQDAIDALWKALYEYEDKTEKQFQESNELCISDWISHRLFVQNMSDIDRDIIQNLPSVKPQQKMGRWMDGFGGCKCSECGCLEAGHSDYCPNCGARTQEVEE